MAQDQIDKNKVQGIAEKESEDEMSFLERELQRELNTAPAPKADNEIRVVVIGGNEQFYRSVLTQLRKTYPDVNFVKFIPAAGKNAFYAIDSLDPDILLVYYNAAIQNANQFHEAILTQNDQNGTPYVNKYMDKRMVVLAPNDYQYIMDLHSRGIKFVVSENDPRYHSADPVQLLTTIHEAYEDIKKQKTARLTEAKTPQLVTPSNAMRRPTGSQMGGYGTAQPEQPMMPHKIIGIYSGTGGAGKTVFATNLASILSKYSQDENTDYRVCLVEYNLACRGVDIYFNIKMPPQHQKSITALAQEATSLFADEKTGSINATTRDMIPLIARYTEHIPSIGLDVIPGISVPLEIDRIGKNFSSCLFPALREMYDVVIVDLSADIAKIPMLEAMNEVNDFYYIMPMDVSSIRNARVLIKFLAGLFKKTPDEIKVIMNKVDPDNEEFGVDQVYSILAQSDCVPEGTIPNAEKDILSSINRGVPIAMEQPEHPVSQAIFSIALGINPMLNTGILEQEQEEKEKKASFFGKLFKGSNKAKKTEEDKPKKSVLNKKKSTKLLAGPKKSTPAVTQPVPETPKEKQNDLDAEFEKEFADEEAKDAKETVEQPKKKGFFARLFGHSGKPKKVKSGSKKLLKTK